MPFLRTTSNRDLIVTLQPFELNISLIQSILVFKLQLVYPIKFHIITRLEKGT